ncbi:MAG TPA: transposase [Roseiarcus sp.]|nr:transposase [Roseiarcus sp.]
MPQVDDLRCSLVAFDQDATLIVVVDMSEASWLVAGMAPGVDRQPLKKLGPDPDALLRLVERWRDEAVKAGKMIERIALAFEAGRDGFWLARWLQARGIEVHVIHSTSVAVSREHRRAKTDRLDTAMLMRVFLGWLRSQRGHCGMVAIPTLEDEDARRPSRERESLVGERTRIINRMRAILAWLGVSGFNPKLRKAPQRLGELRTPEDLPLPPNTVDELRRDMARLAMVCEHCRISCLKPQKAPYVPANRPSFPDDKNPRNCGRLARRATVCEPNSERSPAVCAQYHPPVSACKIPFPGLHDGSGWTETAGAPTWRQQAVEEPEARGAT